MEPKSLEVKTLDQLRALARIEGIRGYSNLRKKQLIELLVKPKALSGSHTLLHKKPKPKQERQKTAKTRAASAPGKKMAREKTKLTPTTVDVEQRIESAKYQVTPTQAPFKQTFTPSLHEDIDNMPAIADSVLCLLPQKPGVVHAYWTLQPGAPTAPLRLRLCHAGLDAIELLDEVDVRSERGYWYFQVPENAQLGGVFGHLGYYGKDGRFITAIERGIARIPALHASAKTDRSWWISDADFQAMYKRAGGVVRGKRLYWPRSGSGASERFAKSGK
jgi:hypothetical protein